MVTILTKLGIKNNDFFLAIYDKDLIGVNPFDPFLTDDIKNKIECKAHLRDYLCPIIEKQNIFRDGILLEGFSSKILKDFIKFDIKTPSNKNIIPNINSTMVIFSLNTFIIKSIILDNNTPSTKEYNLFSCFFRR